MNLTTENISQLTAILKTAVEDYMRNKEEELKAAARHYAREEVRSIMTSEVRDDLIRALKKKMTVWIDVNGTKTSL